jgi:adenylate cyclase
VAVEIERKFLVTGDGWRAAIVRSQRMRQGYLAAGAVQVRIRRVEDEAFLTIKGNRQGISRSEFEYPIPPADADAMLDTLCQHPPIEKVRHDVEHGGHLWEVDVYSGRHEGLLVAEVELDAVDEHFDPPAWIGEDVTEDRRYSNAVLAEFGPPER